MARAKRKAFVDDDGCDIGVQHRRAEGVFEAADDDRLIDERIERTRSLRHSVASPGQSLDEQRR